MSTIKIDLVISSSTVGADKLKLPHSKLISVVPPFTNSGRSTVGNATPNSILGVTAADTMVYLVNDDNTNELVLKTDADVVFGVVDPGEVALLTIKSGSGLKVIAGASTVTYQASYWSK